MGTAWVSKLYRIVDMLLDHFDATTPKSMESMDEELARENAEMLASEDGTRDTPDLLQSVKS